MIFEFISRLLPEAKRSNVEDDLKNTKKIFDEVSIPVINSARDCLKLLKKENAVFQSTASRFYDLTGMRDSKFFLDDYVTVIRNARSNLDYVETQVKRQLEESTFSEAITLRKAQLLRAVAAFGSIADLTPQMVNHLMKAAEIDAGAEQEISKGEEKAYETYTRTLFSILSQYGQEPRVFEKLLSSVPDAMVTPANSKQVEAMFAKDADPFMKAEVNGFIPHPVLVVREQWSNFQISRYEYNKTLKKSFELRVVSLRSQQNGEKNAGLEKQIQYFDNQIAKLQEKVSVFEQKYGG